MKTISNQALTIRAFITVMLIVVLSLVLCLSCASVQRTEGTLEKTRIYVGKYTGVTYKISDDLRLILTSDIIVRCKCDPSIDTISPGRLCYIDIRPCKFDYHSNIAWQLDAQFLVFYSEENPIKYRIVKNHRFY